MKRRAIKKKEPPRLDTKILFNVRSILALTALLLAILRFALLPFVMPSDKSAPTKSKGPSVARGILQQVLEAYNISEKWQKSSPEGYNVFIPTQFPFIKFYISLKKKLEDNHYTIFDSKEFGDGPRYQLLIGSGRDTLHVLITTRSDLPNRKAQVAIIIDDFGYEFDDLAKKFIRFPAPLTISVIPQLKYAKQAAREAAMLEKELLIHMPMEPLNAAYDDEGLVLLTGQPSGEWRVRLKKAFSLIPFANGLNNHQGSKATMDAAMMRIVMDELKKQKLFFVDSKTSPRSVAFKIAKKFRVPAAENNLFIDAIEEEEFIAGQFDRLAEISRKNGSAIGIGHVREQTLKVLEKKIPELESHGYEFVTISKLLQ